MYTGGFQWQLLENSTVYGVDARCRVSQSFYDVMIVGGQKIRDHAALRCKNADGQFCRSKRKAVGETLSSQVLGVIYTCDTRTEYNSFMLYFEGTVASIFTLV